MFFRYLVFIILLFSMTSTAYAGECPENWIERTNLNKILKSSASIKTSQGLFPCKVKDFYAYMSSFIIKCENNATIYRSQNTCEEDDFKDIENGNCIDFINLIDSNGSHFKLRDLYLEKAIESESKVTELFCDDTTITFKTKFHAYQKTFEFTGNVNVTYQYKPVIKPEGF